MKYIIFLQLSLITLLIINVELIFTPYCEFQKLTTGRMIGSAKEKDGLYYFDDGPDLSRQFQSTSIRYHAMAL